MPSWEDLVATRPMWVAEYITVRSAAMLTIRLAHDLLLAQPGAANSGGSCSPGCLCLATSGEGRRRKSWLGQTDQEELEMDRGLACRLAMRDIRRWKRRTDAKKRRRR